MLNDKHVVLLVDDDQGTIDFLDHYFTIAQWITRKANSVIEALSKLDPDVDLVVTDYDMPTLNGADMRQMVRLSFPTIPVFGISGFNFADRDTVILMFDAFLHKPFRISDLRDKISQLILMEEASLKTVSVVA